LYKRLINLKQYQNSFILGLIFLLGWSLLYLTNSGKLDSAEVTSVSQEFFTLFLGLIIEATPFVFLGVLVSILVSLFLNENWVIKYLPRNRILSHFLISFTGVFMPVCECGNVPVARRLMLKGFKLSHSVTFLLAAPIINPITIWTTVEAFGGSVEVVIFRVLGALFIANTAGLLISLNKNDDQLLSKSFQHDLSCKHDHDQDSKIKKASDTFETEFLSLMTMLVFGAIMAAGFRTFVPEDIIKSVGTNLVLSIFAMILLAFVMSICSNVDAFVALTFANRFTVGSIVTFLVFGPMIDIKMLSMLRSTFSKRLLIFLSLYVVLASAAIGLLINLFY
jgi:uncharacterized membrane protein YraQ (UPF0718 family)